MSDLTTLIDRVRGLTGHDREVDGEVWRCVHGDAPRGLKYGNVPKITASLDAVVALIERELPGFSWQVGTNGPDATPFGWVGRDDEAAHLAATPALALLLAFLTAMKEKSHD